MGTGKIKNEIEFFIDNLNKQTNYSHSYLIVKSLHDFIESDIFAVNFQIIEKLLNLVESTRFERQKTSYFYYREITEAIVKVVTLSNSNEFEINSTILDRLTEIFLKSGGRRCHRGISEALGKLPVDIDPPKDVNYEKPEFPSYNSTNFLEEFKRGQGNWLGRSLVLKNSKSEIIVVKMVRKKDRPEDVARESYWMEYLYGNEFQFDKKNYIPRPIKIEGSFLFKVNYFPVEIPEDLDLHPERYAIAYKASKGYFTYPNSTGNVLPKDAVFEILTRNAWLLGAFLSKGLVHTAPIPLFHNRVQRDRRKDGGVYLWTKGGRLDRWLESSKYPNLGESGLRDFEHIETLNNKGRNLYEYIGMHILSLILVAGSYFRNSQENKNDTEDYRYLFDESFFKNLIENIFIKYYEGFTGECISKKVSINYDCLTRRLIDEMGVDNHMEEILRVADQNEMTETAFNNFLKNRGYPEGGIRCEKGKEDVITRTGPHLGGFNQKISVPELIEFLETTAGLCIAGKFCCQKKITFL